MARFALVTSESFPRPDWIDSDSPALKALLESSGHTAAMVPWEGSGQDWDAFDVLTLQSPWSMWTRLGEFRSWLDSMHRRGARIANPYSVVRQGMSKDYLQRLGSAVDVVPTYELPTESTATTELVEELLSSAGRDYGAEALVVKPKSSGGAIGARRLTTARDVTMYIEEMRGSGTEVCLQPYVSTIDTLGEIGVVIIGGQLSHAIIKDAILRPGSGVSSFHPNARPAPELSPADRRRVLAAYDAYNATMEDWPLSVRLDFLRNPADGRLLLLEIESVAPVRFFSLHPDATAAYARVLTEYARG
jgi:hypothetical protein